MQTRRQAKLAELAAAAQSVVQSVGRAPPPPSSPRNANASIVWAPSFASSLSDLTPTSSFVSDAGSVQSSSSLSTITETELGDESNDERNSVAARARAFGVPVLNPRGRSLRTPMPSQSNFYPPEVFETPRKNNRVPTEEERRAAQEVRDSEIASSGGKVKLTGDGTLLVFPDPTPGTESAQDRPVPTGSGLGSPFTSPSSSRTWNRETAQSDRASRRLSPLKRRVLQGAKTEVINPDTGLFK